VAQSLVDEHVVSGSPSELHFTDNKLILSQASDKRRQVDAVEEDLELVLSPQVNQMKNPDFVAADVPDKVHQIPKQNE
jgi:hypothetical protein